MCITPDTVTFARHFSQAVTVQSQRKLKREPATDKSGMMKPSMGKTSRKRQRSGKPPKREEKRIGKKLKIKPELKTEEPPADPLGLLGSEIEVFWPSPYRAWFRGWVRSYNNRGL